MASRTFNGTTNTTFSTASNWDGGVSVPSSGDTLIIESNCILTDNDSNVYGSLTVNNGVSFNVQTFNFNCGTTIINGTHQIGISSSSGFTCGEFTSTSGSTLTYLSTSKFNNSGNISLNSSTIITTNNCLNYTQTGNGTWDFASSLYLYDLTVNSGVVFTAASSTDLVGTNSNSQTINGAISVSSYSPMVIGGKSTCIITIGVNGDFAGSGTMIHRIQNGSTLTNNRTTVFSLTGTLRGGTAATLYPAWNFSNANYIIYQQSTDITRYISNGTLKCKNFTINQTNGTITVNCSTYNPNIEVSGNVVFSPNGGGLMSWVSGSGTMTLVGTTGTQTIDFNGQTIGNLVVNSSGAIKQLVYGKNVTTPSLNVIGGTFDFNTCSCNVTGAVSISGGVTSILKGGMTTPITSTTCNYTKNGTIITITDNNHGHLIGEIVTFIGGTIPFISYRIFNVTTNTFDITTTFGNVSGTCIYTIPKNGLTCNGLSLVNTSTGDFQSGTRIDNYGNLNIGNVAAWKTINTAIYCQRGSANLSSINASGFSPLVFIIYPSITLTLTTLSYIGGNSGLSIISIYGILSTSSLNIIIGAGGGFYLDTNGDISGSSLATIYSEQPYPVSDIKRVTQLSYIGAIQWGGNSGAIRRPLTLWTYGEIRLGQGITNYNTNILQPTTGFGNVIKCSKFTTCHTTNTNAGVIIDNSNNIEIQCSGQVDLGMVMSLPFESKWNKNGTNLRIASNSLGPRTSNVLFSVLSSDNLVALPIDVYDTSVIRNVNLNWTKVNDYDDFITVEEISTPLNVNDSVQVVASSVLRTLNVNALPRVVSKTADSFDLSISIDCKWERVGTTAYITAPFNHNLTSSHIVYMTVTSDNSPLPIGLYTVTGNNGTQFRVTCNDSGSIYGTLTYVSTELSGTLTYRYMDVTMLDSVGSGSYGNCSINGVSKWYPGVSGKIKLTGVDQNLFTSGAFYTLFWTRVGNIATLYFKNTTLNTLSSPHNLINGQSIYIDGTMESDTFPKGMYPITIIDEHRFSVQCLDNGIKPGIVTGCTRSTTSLTIPSVGHGLDAGKTVYLTYTTDQLVNGLLFAKSVLSSGLGMDTFVISASNAGLTNGITVEWSRILSVFIPCNYPKTTIDSHFKYDNIDVDGPMGDLPIFSDFSCVSIGSSSANDIHGSINGVQRNIYVNTDDTGKNSLYSGSTIKDISLGSTNRLNGKTSINLGNNKGIVFKDTIK